MTQITKDRAGNAGKTGLRMDTCRVCGRKLFPEQLLRYENMPGAAQYLPDRNALEQDRGVDLEVRQCSGCGLVQLAGDPVPYYREVIRAAAVSDEMKEFRRDQFAVFMERFRLKGKKVLEIGCGRGEFLSILQQTGMEAYGLEYGEDSVKTCVREELRASKVYIDSGTGRLKNAPFHAFLILNFLEHMPDPNSTLRGIWGNLAEGGVGIVEVPNFDMILRKRLFSEFIGDHLLYFTRETLKTALTNNGFEVIECREVWHEYIISALVKKRERLDLSVFCDHRKRLQVEILEFVERFGDGKVAIWGAGHQALAVISLTGLGEKIRYVVDSAPFKQGRFTPATHIPIVPPGALDSDPVDAVIVMAASYSDEIAGIMQKRYGGRIHIAILRDFGLEIL